MREEDGSALLFAAVSLWFASLFVLFVSSWYAWGFRDGWGGPNYMIESSGMLALRRFWDRLCAPFLVFVVPSFLGGCLLCWLDLRRSAGPPRWAVRASEVSRVPVAGELLDAGAGKPDDGASAEACDA
jgi:hypothetical protein